LRGNRHPSRNTEEAEGGRKLIIKDMNPVSGRATRRHFTTGALKVLALTLAAALLFVSGCRQREEPKKIDIAHRDPPAAEATDFSRPPIRIAVGAMLVPEKGFLYYKELLDFIAEKIGRPIKIVDRESYAEINDLLKEGNIESAFVCSGPYVEGHDTFGLELLAVPVAYGRPVYYSYILAHKDSPVADVEGLRGKSFAFTDPHSNTGKLVPTHLLATMGETPASYFSKTIFTYAHDKSIVAVAEKLVDGAAVDSLIWDYADKTDPQYTSKTKIIWKSPAYGIPPVVVRKDLDGETKERLREIFLSLHEEERGRRILKGLMIDRFIPGEDSLYDSIRDMKRFKAESNDSAEN
jgi:phosphonate transport system substrate-binding protein